MKSEVLIKINNFVKDRIIELSGILLILAGAFLSASILSYSPSDPNFIYNPDNVDIKNIGGFYGSVVADLLLQSVGLVSIFLIINLFNWGLKLITQKNVSINCRNIALKYFSNIQGSMLYDKIYKKI